MIHTDRDDLTVPVQVFWKQQKGRSDTEWFMGMVSPPALFWRVSVGNPVHMSAADVKAQDYVLVGHMDSVLVTKHGWSSLVLRKGSAVWIDHVAHFHDDVSYPSVHGCS